MNPRDFGARCDECPLKSQRPVWGVPATGGPTQLIIIGEGPGRKEVAEGKPFVGPSGSLLNQTLTKAGIQRAHCHVTNTTLCRGETDRENEKAAACCTPRLLAEVGEVYGQGISQSDAPPPPILALGKPATEGVLGVKSILMARGFIWSAPDLAHRVEAQAKLVRAAQKKVEKALGGDPDKREKAQRGLDTAQRRLRLLELRQGLAGRVVFPTVHPAFVMRSDAWRSILEIDVKRVGRWLRGQVVDEAEVARVPSVEEFVA